MDELLSGVYQHFKDGHYYQVLFVARHHVTDEPMAVYLPLYTHKPGRRISVRDAKDFHELVPKPCVTCKGSGKGFSDHVSCHYCKGEGHDGTKIARFTYVGQAIPQ